LLLGDIVVRRRAPVVMSDYAFIRRSRGTGRDQLSRADRNRLRKVAREHIATRKPVAVVLLWLKRPRYRVRSGWEEGLRTLAAGHLLPVLVTQAA
jgi:hypothetical protein